MRNQIRKMDTTGEFNSSDLSVMTHSELREYFLGAFRLGASTPASCTDIANVKAVIDELFKEKMVVFKTNKYGYEFIVPTKKCIAPNIWK